MTGGCSPEIPAFYKKDPVTGREREIQETASLYGLIRMARIQPSGITKSEGAFRARLVSDLYMVSPDS